MKALGVNDPVRLVDIVAPSRNEASVAGGASPKRPFRNERWSSLPFFGGMESRRISRTFKSGQPGDGGSAGPYRFARRRCQRRCPSAAAAFPAWRRTLPEIASNTSSQKHRSRNISRSYQICTTENGKPGRIPRRIARAIENVGAPAVYSRSCKATTSRMWLRELTKP